MAGESKIEDYLVDEVNARKGLIRKLKFIGRSGAPDRLVWIPGWFFPVLVELKDEGKDLEDHQRREHKRLNRTGIKTFMINSKGGVDKLLKRKL